VRFRAENVRLDREFTQARIAHVLRLYAGGHSPDLWQREAAAWLALAVSHLERATKG
jgi:enterochelin esterase-like enzyme